MRNTSLLIFISIILISCKAGKEVTMPFKNHQYVGSRLFPVAKSDADYPFRVWLSASTSVDRIITVSKDSEWGEYSSITEIGTLSTNSVFGKKDKNHFKESPIIPKSGITSFIEKSRKLDLLNFDDQSEPLEIALHQPVSLFVVEIKDGDTFNSFRFNTFFPDTASTNTEFEQVQDLILNEFGISFY